MRRWLVVVAASMLSLAVEAQVPPPLVDHHQHLFSPALAELLSDPYPAPPFRPITADDIIAHLDAAGIRRAAVISSAYVWGQPWHQIGDDEAATRRENAWASLQVAAYPDRLIGFCGINPMAPYAIDEIARCAADPNMRGIKVHAGASAHDYRNAEDVARLRAVWAAANAQRMPIIVHMRTSGVLQVPYVASAAQVLLEELLPAAPDVPVQIAHLAGSGGYNERVVDEVLTVLAEARARRDPRLERVWFEVSGVAMPPLSRDRAALLAQRIRQLGVDRVLYGSDAAVVRNTPAEAWAAFRRLPLTEEEFRTIAGNVAPYLR